MDTISNCSCAAFSYEFKYIEFKSVKNLVEILNGFLPKSNSFLTSRSVVDVQVISVDSDRLFCILKLVYFDPVIN